MKRDLLRLLNGALARALASVAPRTVGATPPPLGIPPRRILFVKLVGMGDAVLAASVIEHLKRRRPDLGVGVLVGPATLEVLAPCATTAVHTYDPAGTDASPLRAARIVREIRARRYDAVIDFEQHILLIASFIWMTGIPVRIGLAGVNNPRSRFQTHSFVLSGAESMWSAYVKLARAIDPALEATSPIPMRIENAAQNAADEWWRARQLGAARVVAFHLGTGSRAPARRWPVGRFAALATQLIESGSADTILLTGTPLERPLAHEFAGLFRGRFVDAMDGVGGIAHTAGLLRKCALVVSNDTGVMHLAAAMGTPTLGLFGPNSPGRYAPIGPHAAALYMTTVPCSPCIQIHEGIVPECSNPEKGRCLLDIDVNSAFHAARRLIAEVCPATG